MAYSAALRNVDTKQGWLLVAITTRQLASERKHTPTRYPNYTKSHLRLQDNPYLYAKLSDKCLLSHCITPRQVCRADDKKALWMCY
jgi:hypothetical protein